MFRCVLSAFLIRFEIVSFSVVCCFLLLYVYVFRWLSPIYVLLNCNWNTIYDGQCTTVQPVPTANTWVCDKGNIVAERAESEREREEVHTQKFPPKSYNFWRDVRLNFPVCWSRWFVSGKNICSTKRRWPNKDTHTHWHIHPDKHFPFRVLAVNIVAKWWWW